MRKPESANFLDLYTEIPYIGFSMQTVVETPAYLASATEVGLTEDERAQVATFLARNPTAGALMAGTGGARKIRFAGRGKGKSGGYRIISFFGGDDIPVFLLDVYGKGSRSNLSKTQRNELRVVLTALPRVWRERAKALAGKAGRK